MAHREILTPIPAIVGPTASGKTALSLSLGAHLSGEIVSSDSMQIYRGMDIGTAKPTAEERAALPHHMLDVAEPTEPYSAAAYTRAARAAIGEILARGKTPLLCGGTGLYLSALRRGGEEDPIPGETAVRAALEKEGEAVGGREALYARLAAVDPVSAAATHPNNLRRVIRALEIYEATGVPKSEWDRRSRERAPDVPMTVIGLRYADRALLYRRIDARVDAMLREGLLDEVRTLVASGRLTPDSTAGQAIGYKELLSVLSGEMPLSLAVEEIKTATRRYAKRQMTWFSADPTVHWITVDREDGSLKTAAALTEEALAILKEKPEAL